MATRRPSSAQLLLAAVVGFALLTTLYVSPVLHARSSLVAEPSADTAQPAVRTRRAQPAQFAAPRVAAQVTPAAAAAGATGGGGEELCDERCTAMGAFTPAATGGAASPRTPSPGSLRPPCARRRVFLDLGVNWCNTARLHERFAPLAERGPEAHWEVYGFEASPLIQPYVDDFFAYLNYERAEPLLCLPRAGSTWDLREYVKRLGCPSLDKRDPTFKLCIFDVFHEHLAALRARPELGSMQLVQRRLAESSCARARAAERSAAAADEGPQPRVRVSSRFVHVPAAASGETGTLHLYSPPQQLIRGGGRPDESGAYHDALYDAYLPNGSERLYRFDVPTVDVAEWMIATLREEDYVIAKLDIEGAEHSLFRKLLDRGKLGLIDVLAYECHPGPGDCLALKREIRRTVPEMQIWVEAVNYTGIDAYSRIGNQSDADFAKWMADCGIKRYDGTGVGISQLRRRSGSSALSQ